MKHSIDALTTAPLTEHSITTENSITTDVLIVGGGTGGTAAAIQAARMGVKTLLVSEFEWLGGMLTSAGVCAPDGNELEAFQTGLWGAFLQELRHRQPEGLDHGWVSFFTYQPAIGAQIFADWVIQLPNLTWIKGFIPNAVQRQGNQVRGVTFESLSDTSGTKTPLTVYAKVTLDGTELGDLLALGNIPHRLGWEFYDQWQEPSSPVKPSPLTTHYPVQAPTWVLYLKDTLFDQDTHCDQTLPCDRTLPIEPTPGFKANVFQGAWDNHGKDRFLNYGGIAKGLFMINWPTHGNDYGEGVGRLFGSQSEKHAFLREAIAHSQNFAHYIQTHLGSNLILAAETFPKAENGLGGGAFALHPYYRESRRLVGTSTVLEQSLLPVAGGTVAHLPTQSDGQVSAIALGNYANDHHYPSGDIPLAPKSMIWGGRWTGTAFCIPYGAIVPQDIDGFLVCDKNISVSHMANGATRLQPVVLGIGQAAGAAAALSVQQGIEPRQLKVRTLQEALLEDPVAPAAIIPFYNLPPSHPEWQQKQIEALERPQQYPQDGYCQGLDSDELDPDKTVMGSAERSRISHVLGRFHKTDPLQYQLHITDEAGNTCQTWQLVTLNATIHKKLQEFQSHDLISVKGWKNRAGGWIRVDDIAATPEAQLT